MSGGLRGSVHVGADAAATAALAAQWLRERSSQDRAVADRFTVALSGGSTPRAMHQLLAASPYRERIAWASWRVYFGDERAVAPDDEQSNYRMARDTLLQHVPIREENVHRMRGEADDLAAAAAEYSQILAETLPPGPDGAPRLDCVLLGLGTNGHIASLFPGTPALEVSDAWATVGLADYEPLDRITITYPTINAAAAVAFLVAGADKAEALRATIDGSVPASRVTPLAGVVHWFLDEAAAAGLQ